MYNRLYMKKKQRFTYLDERVIVLNEHKSAKWLTKDTLHTVDWLLADIRLIDKIREVFD